VHDSSRTNEKELPLKDKIAGEELALGYHLAGAESEDQRPQGLRASTTPPPSQH